ncbi:MAG TPA: ABC transporter ATP-binding protein [Acidimicrobiales bacterium]|nr:ABC transporter ATP-binding protein [Acidimicrobiales bacterium]
MSLSTAKTSSSLTTATTPILDVVGLSVDVHRREDAVRIVDDVSFSVPAGHTVGLVGESGSGKSVTAMSIIRLLAPSLQISEGRVVFDGRDLRSLSPKEMRAVRGKDIGVVFQDPQNSLNPAFTLENQMVETIRAHLDMSKKEALAHAISLLGHVGIPNARRRIKDYPHQFSGGMAQRAMIALAIACRPKLLIADEPTTALDVTVQAQILTLLESLQDEYGMTMLLISHDLSVIAEMADHVVVMYAGEVVERGDVVGTLTAPQHPYTEALLAAQPEASRKGDPLIAIPGMVPNPDSMPAGCHFAPRCGYATELCTAEHPPLDRVFSGSPNAASRCLYHTELRLHGVTTQRTDAEVKVRPERSYGKESVLEVRGLSKTFPLRSAKLFERKSTLVAVDDVSFDVGQGETLGLVGESGAGKSTVGRLVLGLTTPTSGSVLFRGEDLSKTRRRKRQAIRRDIQVVFQNPYASLDPMMTVGQTLSEPLEVHLDLNKRAREARVAELLGHVGLGAEYADRYPHALSGGQRQRVAIARALALNPGLIVCDEPVSSLDVSTQAQVINLLRDLQVRFGIAYLFVGHDLSVVYQISDRVAVMYRGRVVEIGPAEDIYRDPQHPYTQTLLAAILSIDPREHRLSKAIREQSAPDSPGGCPFAHRCPHVMEECRTHVPDGIETTPGRTVWCRLYGPEVSEQARATDDATDERIGT